LAATAASAAPSSIAMCIFRGTVIGFDPVEDKRRYFVTPLADHRHPRASLFENPSSGVPATVLRPRGEAGGIDGGEQGSRSVN